MKRNIIIGCIAAVFSLSACDNYLDIVPKGESVLNQTSDYLGLIEDIYGYPIQSEWYLCGEATSYNMELLENYSSPLHSTAFYWDEDFDRAPYMTATGNGDMYTVCYRKISNYNIIIQNINKSEGSDDDKRYGMAQAKIMRAYAYYRLVQAFGAVTILRDNNQTDLSRSTANAVNKYALEDLQYGIDNMPRIRPNQNEHKGAVTAFSAEMLAAKIHLNMGDYAKVEELTDDIIEHGNFSLYPDFYQLFKIPGKLCDESIFESQMTDFGNGSGDLIDPGEWFTCQGPKNSGSNINGWGDCGILKSFRDWAYNRGETIRATTSFLMADSTTPDGDYIKPQTNPTNTDCWNGKAYTPLSQLTPGRTKYGTNNNVRIFRYADVLLMNAEAKIKNGKSGDAPFNEVRRRAQMPELTNVTFEQVIDERRMELVCEWGERYNDLVRTGLAKTELKGWSEDKALLPLPFNQYTQIPDLLKEPKDE